MSNGFILLLVVVVPCVFVLGEIVGYGRGRRDAEQDLADKLSRRG